MNYAFEIAGVGLSTQQRALDVIANNVANLNTPSFKRSELIFSEIVAQRRDEASVTAGLGAEPSVAGVTVRSALALDQAGAIERTGRALDIAIDGEGFIELMGPRGQALLWRGGTLKVQEDGLLATAGGIPLRGSIAVPANASALQIDADGLVTARAGNNSESTVIGALGLVRAEDAATIERLDGGLYAVSDVASLMDLTPGESGGVFVQGAIEHSNVQLNDEMIRLLIVQRAYGANAQVVQAADQLMMITNNLRR